MRAAANSTASGSPSSRAQIAATAAWFAVVRVKPGWPPCAGDEELDGLGHRQGGDGDVILARESQHDPAGGEDLQPSAVGQQRRDVGRGPDHLLEVVQDEQHLARAQLRHELLRQRTGARVAEAEGPGDRRQDELRVAQRGQFDEADAGGERRSNLLRDPEGEAGLADPSRAGQGDERDVVAEQEVTDGVDLVLAADEGSARGRQRADAEAATLSAG